MKIKHLYNADKEQVALAFFHRKNATVDIRYIDKMQNADETIEFNEFEEYKGRFELCTEDELGQGAFDL